MKKLRSIIIVVLSASTPLIRAKFSEDLQNIKKTLVDTQKQVHDASEEVKSTHGKIEQQLLSKINNALETGVRPQAKKIQNNINEVDGPAKEIGLFVLGAANPIDELRWMRDNPIKTITETLDSLKATFSALNSDINPTTDPKGIYADFKSSEEYFAKAIKNVQDIIGALTLLGL